jgi:hypothetical protein
MFSSGLLGDHLSFINFGFNSGAAFWAPKKTGLPERGQFNGASLMVPV